MPHRVSEADGDAPGVAPSVLETDRHDRHARDAILFGQRHDAEKARLERKECTIADLGCEAGIDIGVTLGEDQEKLSSAEEPYTVARGREQLSPGCRGHASLGRMAMPYQGIGSGDDWPAGHLAGASHQPESSRVLEPVERDENAQRPGSNYYQGATVVEVMEVPSGEKGWPGRG
ncbi:MAG: hypothetical protein K0Q89_540 [Thermomicrobiales bacterium]|nr:hypothetical protein [Thermomicrobiales bacterium]